MDVLVSINDGLYRIEKVYSVLRNDAIRFAGMSTLCFPSPYFTARQMVIENAVEIIHAANIHQSSDFIERMIYARVKNRPAIKSVASTIIMMVMPKVTGPLSSISSAPEIC